MLISGCQLDYYAHLAKGQTRIILQRMPLSQLKAKPDLDLLPPCRQEVFQGEAVNLDRLPLLRPWPGDAGRIITLGLVITKDP